MPASEQRDQQFLNHPLLPNDHAAQFIADAAIRAMQRGNGFDIIGWKHENALHEKKLLKKTRK